MDGRPDIPKKAVNEAPESLRAIFGQNKWKNAVYGANNAGYARTWLTTFFPDGFKLQRTLALIKPGTADRDGTVIMNRIVREGFKIVARQRVLLTKERAEMFYAEHRRRSFFGKLTDYMSSGPVYAMVLTKVRAGTQPTSHVRACCAHLAVL